MTLFILRNFGLIRINFQVKYLLPLVEIGYFCYSFQKQTKHENSLFWDYNFNLFNIYF